MKGPPPTLLSNLLFLLSIAALALWPFTIYFNDELTFLAKSDTRYSIETVPNGIAFFSSTHAAELWRITHDNARLPFGWSVFSTPWGIFNLPPGSQSAPTPTLPPASGLSFAPTTGPPTFYYSTQPTNFRYWVPPKNHLFGFGVESRTNGAFPIRRLVIPLWFLALGILPTLVRIRTAARLRRRLRNNHCPTCGYDLRATPTRCPECGYAPPKPVEAKI